GTGEAAVSASVTTASATSADGPDGATAGGAAEAGAAAAPVASVTTASLVPTSTVAPSGTRISETTPDAGEGTSESTLSVETSNSGSSWAIGSPTFFIQRMIVPSVTVSPSCGIVMSGNVKSPSRQGKDRLAEGLGQRRMRLYVLRYLLRRRFPVDGQVGLPELLCHPRAGHVHAQEASRSSVRQFLANDLHEPVGLAEDAGAAV